MGWHKSSHLFLVTSLLCLSLLVSLHLLLGGKVVLAGILEVLKELGVHSSHRCMNQHLWLADGVTVSLAVLVMIGMIL